MKFATILLLTAGAALTGLADAQAQSEGLFGVLRVDSTATNTIVCVPWVNPSAGTASGITVADIVKTSNLTAGDELLWYDPSKKSYESWQLQTVEGQKKWVAAASVSVSGTSAGTSAEEKALSRGSAFFLKRTQPTNPGYFFLCGQYTTSDAEVTMAAGTADAAAFTLLAPPGEQGTDFDLNAGATWSNVGTGDEIYVSTTNGSAVVRLTYSSGNWGQFGWSGTPPTKSHDTSKAKVPAGLGIWYKSAKNAASAPSVTWSAPAK